MHTLNLVTVLALGVVALASTLGCVGHVAERLNETDDPFGCIAGIVLAVILAIVSLGAAITLYIDLDGHVFVNSWWSPGRFIALWETTQIVFSSLILFLGIILTGRNSASKQITETQPNGETATTRELPVKRLSIWQIIVCCCSLIGLVSSVLGIISFYLDHGR